MPRKPQAATTHRFQTVLTRELCDKLCETHATGKDYRNVTAARCNVHPKLLSKWLRLGRDSEELGLATELFMRFTAIEGEIRAGWIAELENTSSGTETTEFGDNGKPISRTLHMRRTSGVQWLMERRFRQFRTDYVLSEHETDALALLEPPAQALTLDMATQLCQQIAANPERLPAAIRTLFAGTDWHAPKTLEAHGQETSH